MAEVFPYIKELPMSHDWFSVLGADRLIDSVESFLNSTSNLIPTTLEDMILVFLAVSVFVLGLGFVFRLFFGAHCLVNRSISGFLGVLFVYAVTVTVYTLRPWNLTQYLSPLPFAIFRKDILIITSSACSTISLLCSQLLSLIILCFIIHLLNFLLPNGRSFIGWLFFRLIAVALAIFLNLAANWALNTFLPDVIANSAPVALMAVLAVALLVSLFNPLLCILFTVANPVIGLLYTFFFSNTIGKNLTRAVLSAALTCGLFYLMEYVGFSVIDITHNALLTYAPFAAALLGIWFVFDYKL
ncbi:MAG: hypothetical protein ACI3XG_00955 [Faecousia sp.]